jgi:D-alanyl-D-alanine carboxypeptidase
VTGDSEADVGTAARVLCAGSAWANIDRITPDTMAFVLQFIPTSKKCRKCVDLTPIA